MTNPVTGAETRDAWRTDAELGVEVLAKWFDGQEVVVGPGKLDGDNIAADLRALLASLATLREELDDSRRAHDQQAIESDYRRIAIARLTAERDALLAIVNADRTAVCSECLSEALSEEGRVQLYQQLLRDGLSDAEARGTSWPAEPCNHNRLLRTAIDAARAPQGRTE
jgi:hypothetical protein